MGFRPMVVVEVGNHAVGDPLGVKRLVEEEPQGVGEPWPVAVGQAEVHPRMGEGVVHHAGGDLLGIIRLIEEELLGVREPWPVSVGQAEVHPRMGVGGASGGHLGIV